LFRKIVSDKGEVYYENTETGEVVWMMPKDGELIKQPLQYDVKKQQKKTKR
jgi:hypothetical protein